MTELSVQAERFLSFSTLRARHYLLLQGDPSISDIVDFVARTRETGRILANSAERDGAQAILNYWSAELVRLHVTAEVGLLHEFDPALAPLLDDSLCPYVGLRAFEEGETAYFFGRHAAAEKILGVLQEHHLAIVSGISGSGKSSVVRAGVLPLIKKHQLFESVLTLVPGSDPLSNLSDALAKLSIEPPTDRLAERLLRESCLTTILSRQHNRTLFVIDQFEEIFTLAADRPDVQRAFVTNLIDLAESDNGHAVVITVRGEYEFFFFKIEALDRHLEPCRVRLDPLSATDLRDAIACPAAAIGLHFEDGLVEDLVRQVVGELAGLPLLQFTLRELWAHREGNRITWSAYRIVGTPRDALMRTAENLYTAFMEPDRRILKNIFLRLVRPGESGEIVNNRERLKSVLTVGVGPQVQLVIDRLVKAGLLRITSRGNDEDTQLEVAHEALIRNWPRLGEWVEADRNRMRARLRLTAAAEAWQASGRDPGGLLAGKLLRDAELFEELNALENEFLEAGRQAEERLKAEQEAIRQRQLEHVKSLAAEQQKRAEDNARAAKRMKLIATLFALATMLAIVSASVAGFKSKVALRRQEELTLRQNELNRQREQILQAQEREKQFDAEQERLKGKFKADLLKAELAATEKLRAESVARELASESRTNVDTNPELGLLLAKEAGEVTLSHREALVPEARTALHQALQAPVPIKVLPQAGTLLDVNHSQLATTSIDGIVSIWDTASWRRQLNLNVVPRSFSVRAIGLDDNSKDLVLVGSREVARLNLLTKQIETRYAFDSPVSSVSLNLRAGIIAIGGADPRVINAATGSLIKRLSPGTNSGSPFVFNLALSPSGRLVAASCSDQSVRVFNAETGNEVKHFNLAFVYTTGRLGLAISPDDKALATQGPANNIELHSLVGEPSVRHLDGMNAIVTAMVFSKNGRYLAAASDEGATKVWDIQTGKLVSNFTSPGDLISAIVFDDDLGRLFITTRSGVGMVWKMGPIGELSTFSLGDSRIESVATNWNGSVIATVVNSQLRIWSEEPLLPRPMPGLLIKKVALSADGTRAAVIGNDRKLTVVDLINGGPTATFPLHELADYELADLHKAVLALSRKGNLLAVGTEKGVQVWDVTAKSLWGRSFVPPFGDEQVGMLVFSANGEELAMSSVNHDVISYNIKSGRESRFIAPEVILDTPTSDTKAQFASIEERHDDLALSADGTILAAATLDNAIAIWDVSTEKLRRLLPGQSYPIVSIAISPSDKYIAAAYRDGFVRAWNVSNGIDLFRLVVHDSSNVAVVFSSDEVLRVVDGNHLQSYSMQDFPLLRLADTRITRSFTPDECEAFVSISSQRCQALRLVGRGEREAAQQKIQIAVNIFRKAKVLDPTLSIDPEQRSKEIAAMSLVASGRKLAAAGSKDKAVLDFIEAKRLKPTLNIDPEKEANRLLGRSLRQKGDNMASEGHVEEAVAAYERAKTLLEDASLNPKARAQEIAARAFYSDGVFAAHSGDHEKALTDLRHVHDLSPFMVEDPERTLRDWEAQDLGAKAALLAQRGKIDESIITLNKAREMSAALIDSDVVTLNTLCWFGALYDHAQAVLFACDRAVGIQPQNGNVLDSRAVAKARAGDNKGAIEDFKHVLELPFGDLKFKQTRRDWLTKIEQGINPFTPDVINKLLPTNLGETPD